MALVAMLPMAFLLMFLLMALDHTPARATLDADGISCHCADGISFGGISCLDADGISCLDAACNEWSVKTTAYAQPTLRAIFVCYVALTCL